MSDLEAVLAHIESNLDAAYERLIALLRIRSTDPAYAQECRACADWRVQDLRDIGFEAVARQTRGSRSIPLSSGIMTPSKHALGQQ